MRCLVNPLHVLPGLPPPKLPREILEKAAEITRDLKDPSLQSQPQMQITLKSREEVDPFGITQAALQKMSQYYRGSFLTYSWGVFAYS